MMTNQSYYILCGIFAPRIRTRESEALVEVRKLPLCNALLWYIPHNYMAYLSV